MSEATSRCRTRAGFTLIELMVVVTIIILLISILLPGMGKAREYARTAVCASNLRQIGLAQSSYTTEFRYYSIGLDEHVDNNLRWWLWPSHYRRGTGGSTSVFSCPSANPISRGLPTRWVKKYGSGLPAYDGYEKDEVRILGSTHVFSYGYNIWGAPCCCNNPSWGLGGYRGNGFCNGLASSKVVQPFDMIAFADSDLTDFWSGFIGPYRGGQYPIPLHHGSSNVLYCDARVQLKTPAKLLNVADGNINRQWNWDHNPH